MRDRIVAALAAIDGLAATRSRPKIPADGSAWPAWASTRWLNMRADGPRQVRWFVFVVLPAGTPATSVEAGEPLVEIVGQAMSDIQLAVELVEPVAIQVANQAEAIPALRFTLAD